MRDTNPEFWNRVKSLLDGKSLRQMCIDCGFKYSTMVSRNAYQNLPTDSDVRKIADYLSTTPEYLLTGYDELPSDPRLTILKELIKDSTKMKICEALMNASNEQIIAIKLILGV